MTKGEARLVNAVELEEHGEVTSPDGWTAKMGAFVAIVAEGERLDRLGVAEERAQAWPLADIPGLIDALTSLRDHAIEDGLLRRADA